MYIFKRQVKQFVIFPALAIHVFFKEGGHLLHSKAVKLGTRRNLKIGIKPVATPVCPSIFGEYRANEYKASNCNCEFFGAFAITAVTVNFTVSPP
jgi:hypothetical protein